MTLREYEQVKVLIDMFPYAKYLSNQVIVIKYGGSAMLNQILKQQVVDDVIFFSHIGLHPILVHGGGKTINFWLNKLSIEPLFRNGVRVTDSATMDVVEMVLAGKINKELVALINTNGGNAVGLSGKDGSLALAKPLNMKHMGFVGNIVNIDTKILSLLIDNCYIPVVASISYDQLGQTYNINADTFASRIAISMNAEKLIFLTDTPGILLDIHDTSTLIQVLDISEADQLEQGGIITGGMIPKVHSCVNALKHGVISTYIIDGRAPHSLLPTVLTGYCNGSSIITTKTSKQFI